MVLQFSIHVTIGSNIMLQDVVFALVCPILEEKLKLLKDQAAEQLEMNTESEAPRPQYSPQESNNNLENSKPQYYQNSASKTTGPHYYPNSEYQSTGPQYPSNSEYQSTGPQYYPATLAPRSSRAQWREGRGQRPRRGPNILQRLLMPINRVAAMG